MQVTAKFIQEVHSCLLDLKQVKDVSYEELFPTFVFLGNQSSGKSTLIERLLGLRDTLPKGRGMSTRQPWLLKVRNASNYEHEEDGKEGTVLIAGETFESATSVSKKKISTNQTNTPDVSDKWLPVTVISDKMFPCNLIDLPGLVCMSGNQSEDTAKKLWKIAAEACRAESRIILLVNSTSVDIETSEAFALARSFDPHLKRTHLVETMSDLMLLESTLSAGKAYKFASKNRVNCKDPEASLDGLRTKLDEILCDKTRQLMPKFTEMLQNRTVLLERHLMDSMETDDPSFVTLNAITTFVKRVDEALQGRPQIGSESGLVGGAKIQRTILDKFGARIVARDPLEGLTDDYLRLVIENAAGMKPLLFLPVQAFESLVKQQIFKIFFNDMMVVLSETMDDMKDLILHCAKPWGNATQHKRLTEMITTEAEKSLEALEPNTKLMLNNLLEIELGYINCNEPQFHIAVQSFLYFRPMIRDNSNLSIKDADSDDSTRPSTPEHTDLKVAHFNQDHTQHRLRMNSILHPSVALVTARGGRWEIHWMKTLVTIYINSVKKTMTNLVPKTIIRFLVNGFSQNVSQHLIKALYKDSHKILQKSSDELAEIEGRRRELETLHQISSKIKNLRIENSAVRRNT